MQFGYTYWNQLGEQIIQQTKLAPQKKCPVSKLYLENMFRFDKLLQYTPTENHIEILNVSLNPSSILCPYTEDCEPHGITEKTQKSILDIWNSCWDTKRKVELKIVAKQIQRQLNMREIVCIEATS